MAAKRTPKKPTKGTPEQRSAAHARAQECAQKIAKILAEMECSIVPALNSELVGETGQKVLLWATYGVIPNVVE